MIKYKKKCESDSLFYWCLFALGIIMLGNMIEEIYKSPVYMALAILITGGMIWLLIFGGIKWIWNFYIAKYPFKLKFIKQKGLIGKKQNIFTDKIIITLVASSQAMASKYPESIEFRIYPRKILIFEQVGFKLEKKRWCWTNNPNDIAYVSEIIDINIENEQQQVIKTHIADMRNAINPRDNIKTVTNTDGWTIGQYPVPETCPKGDSLLLKIKLYIVIKRKWKGYIIFKHIRGADYQGCARLPIEINLLKMSG